MKGFKIVLVIAGVLVLVGGILLTLALVKGDSFTGAGENKEQLHEELGEFESIDIDTDVTDIVIMPSDNSKNYIKCIEKEKYYHDVSVDNNKLVIRSVDTRKFYERFFGSFKQIKVIVYLKDTTYDELKVKGDTGDVDVDSSFTFNNIHIELSTGDSTIKAKVNEELYVKASTGNVKVEGVNLNAVNIKLSTGHITLKDLQVSGSLDLKATTGKMTLTNCQVTKDISATTDTGRKIFTDVTCDNLTLESSTGDIELTRTVASGKLSIKASTGDITFDHSDASEIKIKTSTGDITGTLLTEKNFYATSNTGTPDVPHTSGGLCEIETDTGRIKIRIAE